MTDRAVEEQAEEATGEDEADGGKPMSFWEHLEELRTRIIRSLIALVIGCLAAWTQHERLLNWLEQPLDRAWQSAGLAGNAALHQAALTAGFTAYVKLALIGGLLLAAPVIFYQLWSFVAPGLYAREKKYVIPFVGLSTVLFAGGAYFSWRVAIPLSFRFFLNLAGGSGDGHVAITPTLMVGEYIDFCLQVLLGFGLTFELPMFLLFLSIAGVVNYLSLLRFARWFIFLAFVVAAVLTPPDVISQLAMAIPMCLLYGLSIGLVYLFGKPPTDAEKKAYRASKKKKAA